MTRAVGPLVVGGGLAGCMAAMELAAAGRNVTLLEKSRGPHDKVCGEFLSRESLPYLARHGICPEALGAVPIRSVRLVTSRFSREAQLPFTAWSLTRKTLDEAMLRCASQAGVMVQRDACVTSLSRHQAGWSVALGDGSSMQAGEVFLATGKHDMRGWMRPPGRQRDLVAFKMYYRLTPEQQRQLGSAVELALFPGGYAGLQPVESGMANLCLLIQSRYLRGGGPAWAGVLQHLQQNSRHLETRLSGATAMLQKPLTLSRIPYGHLQREAEDHLWRVGDQATVIPSFCGDGMSIALHSGALAASCLLQGGSAGAYQALLHRQLRERMWAATTLSQTLVRFPHAAQLVRLFPRLLPAVALMTRIPKSALAPLQPGEG